MTRIASILALVAIALLSGCDFSSTPRADSVAFEVMPDELADCQVFELTAKSGKALTAMRCPNSITSTTYRAGKQVKATVVIDGATYTPEKPNVVATTDLVQLAPLEAPPKVQKPSGPASVVIDGVTYTKAK